MMVATQMRNTLEGDEQFYLVIRSKFVSIGGSVNAWSKANGYHHQNVRAALLGKWNGPRAEQIRREVVEYLANNGAPL